MNDSGNFSIQVLRDALERFHNIELVPWFQNRDGDNLDPLLQKGFVVNRWADYSLIVFTRINVMLLFLSDLIIGLP